MCSSCQPSSETLGGRGWARHTRGRCCLLWLPRHILTREDAHAHCLWGGGTTYLLQLFLQRQQDRSQGQGALIGGLSSPSLAALTHMCWRRPCTAVSHSADDLQGHGVWRGRGPHSRARWGASIPCPGDEGTLQGEPRTPGAGGRPRLSPTRSCSQSRRRASSCSWCRRWSRTGRCL